MNLFEILKNDNISNINEKIKYHRFPYEWTLKDAIFTKDKGKVFSCFSCGGGSTMGYKLAGFDVIGCNEIDPKMMDVYKLNHSPKYSFLESIVTFKNRNDLPNELYNLDILDGSPPCSSFSMAGNRGKDWGKEKKFREGQQKQVLDTLFFDFIDLAKKLQPKVVIAENVKGLLLGSAKKYVENIHNEFEKAGYYCQHFLLDASKMGVPQKRERVFFICLRKDLSTKFLYEKSLFNFVPKIKMEFDEKPITYGEIEDKTDLTIELKKAGRVELWNKVKSGEYFSSVHIKGHYFQDYKLNYKDIVPTQTANDGNGCWNPIICRMLNCLELCKVGTFPKDYNFGENKTKYLIGMSVPPVMTANIVTEIYNQWLCKL